MPKLLKNQKCKKLAAKNAKIAKTQNCKNLAAKSAKIAKKPKNFKLQPAKCESNKEAKKNQKKTEREREKQREGAKFTQQQDKGIKSCEVVT